MKQKQQTSRLLRAAALLSGAALFLLTAAIAAYQFLPAPVLQEEEKLAQKNVPVPFTEYEIRKARLLQDYISHRGNSAGWQEHSFEAYDHAIALGSRYIEQDLVLSQDGTLWISHDQDPYRLTGVHGDFAQMGDDQIRQLTTWNGEPLYTLQDVVDRYGDMVHYVVEIRQQPGALETFIQFVQKNHLEENVIVQVWSLEQAALLRETFPHMAVLFLASDIPGLVRSMVSASPDIICFPKRMAGPALVQWIHIYGKLAAVWTLNTEEEIRAMKDMDIDIYFTDDTGLAESEKYT